LTATGKRGLGSSHVQICETASDQIEAIAGCLTITCLSAIGRALGRGLRVRIGKEWIP
jgi:hypothetical protein